MSSENNNIVSVPELTKEQIEMYEAKKENDKLILEEKLKELIDKTKALYEEYNAELIIHPDSSFYKPIITWRLKNDTSSTNPGVAIPPVIGTRPDDR